MTLIPLNSVDLQYLMLKDRLYKAYTYRMSYNSNRVAKASKLESILDALQDKLIYFWSRKLMAYSVLHLKEPKYCKKYLTGIHQKLIKSFRLGYAWEKTAAIWALVEQRIAFIVNQLLKPLLLKDRTFIQFQTLVMLN